MSEHTTIAVVGPGEAAMSTEESVKRFFEDNDPQGLFYLNPVASKSNGTENGDDRYESLFETQYNWATKIEDTVQEKFGSGTAKTRHVMQACWNRAAYRAKLADYLARITPWMTMSRNDASDPKTKKLTGDYFDDKQFYYSAASSFLSASFPEVPADRLVVIEEYIAETLVSSQAQLTGVQRFAVACPLSSDNAILVDPAIRVITLGFERKKSTAGVSTVEISGSLYEAKVNMRLFGEQKFDAKLQKLGKSVVDDMTLQIVL